MLNGNIAKQQVVDYLQNLYKKYHEMDSNNEELWKQRATRRLFRRISNKDMRGERDG